MTSIGDSWNQSKVLVLNGILLIASGAMITALLFYLSRDKGSREFVVHTCPNGARSGVYANHA